MKPAGSTDQGIQFIYIFQNFLPELICPHVYLINGTLKNAGLDYPIRFPRVDKPLIG